MTTRTTFRTAAYLLAIVATLCAATPLVARQPEDAPAAQPEATNLSRADEAFTRRDYAAAVDLYHAAQQDGIDHAMLHFRLGYSLHALGRIEEAMPHHVRGARISFPGVRRAGYYNAACANALLGNTDEALRFLQHAIDAGFTDTALAAEDPDLASLRDDERFDSMLAGIGVAPTLGEQLDFLLGEWELDTHDRVLPFIYRRQVERSAAIFYESVHPEGLSWAGVLLPDAATRTWEWVYCDDQGTTFRFTGTATGDSVVWLGHQFDAGGQSLNIRMTQTIMDDGRLLERSENSEDGEHWHLHHEEYLTPVHDR